MIEDRHAEYRAPLTVTILIAFLLASTTVAQAPNSVVLVKVEGIINQVTLEHFREALHQAESSKAACLILQMDTPGGFLDTTREMVKDILNARVPVVVFVAPRGARAASAGVFITLASHVAAMAPSTNIGAAHPVITGMENFGEDLFKQMKKKQEEQDQESPLIKGLKELAKRKDADLNQQIAQKEPSEQEGAEQPEYENIMGQKIMQDTLAWVRGIARMRGRNEKWAVEAVTKSSSITAEEALEKDVIDMICPDVDELLERINGISVKTADGNFTIDTSRVQVVEKKMSFRQEFLAVITNPNIAYLLMSLGFLGILIELYHPGAIFPGVIGGICSIIAIYAFQFLPVNYAGVAMIILAIILFIMEIKVQSYGLLSVGGIISLLIGSLMLYGGSEAPGIGVSRGLVFGVVFAISAIIVLMIIAITKVHTKKTTTGDEGLIGMAGTAKKDFSEGKGLVLVHGELWSAISDQDIKNGDEILVIGKDGFKLKVKRK